MLLVEALPVSSSKKLISIFLEGNENVINDIGWHRMRITHPSKELLERRNVALRALYRRPHCLPVKPESKKRGDVRFLCFVEALQILIADQE